MALKNSRISVSLNQAAKELNISIDDIINIAANTENKIKVSLYVHEADTDFKCPSELFNRQFITFLAGINTPNGVIQFIDYSGLSWDGLGGWKTVPKGISYEIKQRQYRHCDTNIIEQVRLHGFWDVLNPLDVLHGKGLIKLHLGLHNEARISGEPIQAWSMNEIKTSDLVLLNDCYDELRAITAEMIAQDQATCNPVPETPALSSSAIDSIEQSSSAVMATEKPEQEQDAPAVTPKSIRPLKYPGLFEDALNHYHSGDYELYGRRESLKKIWTKKGVPPRTFNDYLKKAEKIVLGAVLDN